MLMMIGEERQQLNPTVHISSPRSIYDDPTVRMISQLPVSGVSMKENEHYNESSQQPLLIEEMLTALHRYIDSKSDISGYDSYLTADTTYASDEFRMYDFKVRRCTRGRTHEWVDCPFVHPGEKVRRRDPRKFCYSGTACTEFRKGGNCKKGDTCEFAHGVFECWLHPDRYRTQPCKDGTDCRRRVCFFAHTPDQLRVVNERNSRAISTAESPIHSYDGSPIRNALLSSSPTSTLFSHSIMHSSPSDSPPMSPLSQSFGSNSSTSELVTSLRNLHLSKLKSTAASAGFYSPRCESARRLVFNSLPTTPIGTRSESGLSFLSDPNRFERMGQGMPVNRVEPETLDPDVRWVSDLLK